MRKGGFFRSFWLRAVLRLLAWETVVLAIAWVLFRRMSWLPVSRFPDVLLIVGVLEVMTASFGMMSQPYGVSAGPGLGVPALPVQVDENERRFLMLAEFMEKRSFVLRLVASGLLTIILSLVLTYGFN